MSELGRSIKSVQRILSSRRQRSRVREDVEDLPRIVYQEDKKVAKLLKSIEDLATVLFNLSNTFNDSIGTYQLRFGQPSTISTRALERALSVIERDAGKLPRVVKGIRNYMKKLRDLGLIAD